MVINSKEGAKWWDSMKTQDVKSKLSAILSTDVEGYSHLMGEDEVATIRTLTPMKPK